MKIAVRKSPHLETLVASIERCGDTITSVYDTGADYWLAWGWPQAQQCVQDGAPTNRMICVDAHPFALMAGDRSGARILQLGSWGALARYPTMTAADLNAELHDNPPPKHGPILVIGQVYTAEQKRLGLVDVWHTGGYEVWCRTELAKPGRKFRKHPRIWLVENPGEVQPSLAEDLAGCSMASCWNSTVGIHARLLGWPSQSSEQHAWGHLSMALLRRLVVLPSQLASGEAWASYREWLGSQT